MAGHSKFKNIMHRKGAQDKKRAKLFSRLIREISVSAKLGSPDPDSNPRLRSAINNALSSNMTKESIDKAIKKQTSTDDKDLIEEIIYEGFGPNGVAIIVEALTDIVLLLCFVCGHHLLLKVACVGRWLLLLGERG